MSEYAGWNQVRADVFWGDLAFGDHVVQIYETERIFIDALEGFVTTGISLGDCCVVIATESHLKALNRRLESHGARISSLEAETRYIPLLAEDMLSRFMVNGMPNEDLFMQAVLEIFQRAHQAKRMVRAFGEMVAILWVQGNHDATLELERFWCKFLATETFCLFCAYPKSGFKKRIHATSVYDIYGIHSKIISGSENQLTDVYYKDRTVA